MAQPIQTEWEPKKAMTPANPPPPSTPITAVVPLDTPSAPKKPKGKILEYLKPTLYKPSDNSAPKAPKEILDALSRAGIRKSPSSAPQKPPKKIYPAPRKLFVAIVDGKTEAVIHKYVPVRPLMLISAKAAEFLEPKPWAGKYKIYGKYNTGALSGVLNAIVLHAGIPVVTSDDETSLPCNLLTYEACLRLGISCTHASVKTLLKTIYTQISSSSISSDVLALITYRLGPEDVVFTHTANVLCYQRFSRQVDDVKVFERLVAKKPALQKAMVQIDQSHKARREAINASKRAGTKAEGVLDLGKDSAKVENATATDEMVEKTVGAALVGTPGVDEEQKEQLLKLLKTAPVAEKDEGSVQETTKMENSEKTEKVE